MVITRYIILSKWFFQVKSNFLDLSWNFSKSSSFYVLNKTAVTTISINFNLCLCDFSSKVLSRNEWKETSDKNKYYNTRVSFTDKWNWSTSYRYIGFPLFLKI